MTEKTVNQTLMNELYLSGLSDLQALQLPMFLFFLLVYFLTITWNLLIIALIVADSHLHTPMYFFLGNLASLDLCCSSVTVPRMLYDLLTQRRKITTTACLTQFFFFIFFAGSEFLLLAVMSHDRYNAICQPLHYTQTMNRNVCVQLASIVGCVGFINALVHTLSALNLSFCESHFIESFFCDLPQLLQISCSDIYINILLIFVFGGIIAVVSLVMTIFPYISIFKTVLKIQVKGKRSKVFSTCSSHLTVVFIFYSSSLFNYFRPGANNHFAADKVVSIFYSVIVPFLNPLIYSLRNQDFRTAFQNVLLKKILQNRIQKSSQLKSQLKKNIEKY